MVYTHGVAFARYSDIAQAREVIMRCHKTECHGTVIDVKPATDRTHTPKHQKESGNKTSSKPRSLMRSNTRFSQGRRELPGMGVEERTRGVSRTDDQRTLWRDGRLLMYMSDDDDTEVGFSPAGSETSHDDITMDQLVLLDDEMSGPVSTPAKLSVLMTERQANGLRMDSKETGLKVEHKDNGWSAKCLGLRGKLQETPNGRATATTVQPGSLHGRDFLSLTSLSSNSDSGRSKNVDQANGCRDRECKSILSQGIPESSSGLNSFIEDTCPCDASVTRSCDQWEWDSVPPESGHLDCQANHGEWEWDTVSPDSSANFNKNLIGRKVLRFKNRVLTLKLDSEWKYDISDTSSESKDGIGNTEWEWDTIPSESGNSLLRPFHVLSEIPSTHGKVANTCPKSNNEVEVAASSTREGPPFSHSCSAVSCAMSTASSQGPLHPPQELISDSYLERDESLLSPRPDTPDSLDDFEWDWSLLPPRSSVAAVGSLARQANTDRPLSPSTDTSSSAKPSVSATSPVSTADEAFEFGSSSNDVTLTRSALGYSGTSDDNDDDDFWHDTDREEEEERVVSGSYLTCGSCHHNSSSTPDCTLDTRLVCGVISKIEDPDNMWVQLGSDPGSVIEEMSVKMYKARPPKLQQTGLGTVCCLLLPSPLQKEKKYLIRRALIKENTQKHVMEPQVGVILVDVGTVFQFAVSHLRELPECVGVTIYPPLASPLALRGVASSYYDGDQWYSLDVDTIRQLLKNKKVYMLPWGSNGEPVLRSKCGHRLVAMFLDPHGEESVADKLIEDCHFVVRLLPNRAKMPVPSIDMAPPVSFQQSLTGIDKVRSSKDLPCTAVSHGVTEGRDRTDERGASGRRGGRRSMMGRLMKAVQDLEAAKLSSDPVT